MLVFVSYREHATMVHATMVHGGLITNFEIFAKWGHGNEIPIFGVPKSLVYMFSSFIARAFIQTFRSHRSWSGLTFGEKLTWLAG